MSPRERAGPGGGEQHGFVPPRRTLPRSFYRRPVVELGQALLGQVLVRRRHGVLCAGRIVETEVYGGEGVDDSAHSFRGPTPRCEVMFGAAGMSYVYMTQGALFCMNVSAQGDRAGKAVLLRAVEPLAGVEQMRARRRARLAEGPTRRRLQRGHEHELAQGPGRLCLAFDIDRQLNGLDLTDEQGPLFLVRGEAPGDIRWTPRVGLNPAAFSFRWRWRAFDAASDAVSKGRSAGARRWRRPWPEACPLRAD